MKKFTGTRGQSCCIFCFKSEKKRVLEIGRPIVNLAGLDRPSAQESDGECIFTLFESEGAASTVVHDRAEHAVLFGYTHITLSLSKQ